MRKWIVVAWGAALAIAFADLSIAFAAAGETGEDGPRHGRDAFRLDQFEGSMWTPQRRATEQAKSDARRRNIQRLLDLAQDPAYANKAEAYFRLAENHWEEARFQYFMSREKYEADYRCYEEQRCATEPEEPTEDYSVAIDYYRKVLLADPNYSRLDQVTYFLGRAAIEAGGARKDRQLEREGEKHLQDVIQRFPRSRYVPESHLTLAEYYFDRDSLYYAKSNYEKIIENHRDHAMFNYALYKLGWVYFNLAEFEQTIDTFKRVIASVSGARGGGMVEFRAQALRDIVQAYSEVDNGWRLAREYFLGEVGEQETYEKLDQMAGLLVSKDRDDDAIDLYKHLIAHDRTSPKLVEYYDAVLEVRRKIGDMGDIEAEINELAGVFAANSQWILANQGNREITDAAHELVSVNLSMMANHYHREAQALTEKRRKADREFAAAARYYKEFLDRYPDHEDSYKLNFFYAEILFHELKEYGAAAEQYERVLAKDTRGEFVEDAALGVVFAVEAELDREGIRERPDGEIVREVNLDQELRRDDAEREIEQTELHPLERRMIAAADRYVEVLSAALEDPEFRQKYPDRGARIPNMMYIAAEMFYSHGQFREAVSRLQVIFDLFPNHEMAHHAVNLIIDAYRRLKRWEQIEYWARELIRTKNFAVKTRAELELFIAIAKTEHATDLTRQRRYDEAVKVQQDIVSEFGRSNREIASKALFNIGAIHEIARRFPQAVEAYEEVIRRYKDMEVAVEAQAAIGILYESQTDFRRAAEAFVGMQQFRARFRNNPQAASRAADAYRDAGILYEALEDYDEAHKVFTNYTKLYADRDDAPRVAFQAAYVLELKDTPESYTAAAREYERLSRSPWARRDAQYRLRTTAAAGLAYKKADKEKNRRRVEGLLRNALREWSRMAPDAAAARGLDPSTQFFAASSALELAEYKYDDFNRLRIEAINNRGGFDMGLLRRTLTAKAEALIAARTAFEEVLEFTDRGMIAAAAFRIGQILYEFAQSLFEAPAPPQLTPDQVDEYKWALEEVAAPIEEQALVAFTAALRQAVNDNVYNRWSRMSAIYAARVNRDEFPIAEFSVQPDKTADTIQSTSFIKSVVRGSTVVDYLRQTETRIGRDAESEDQEKEESP